jgi:hypothetical protein
MYETNYEKMSKYFPKYYKKLSLDLDAKILDKDNTWKYIKINSKLKRRSATGDHHLEK